MQPNIKEIAERIKALREIMERSAQQMADQTGVSLSEYEELESGTTDFSFTFLYKCAEAFGVDMVELLTGENPKLSRISIVRKDTGLAINRRKGFAYRHLAATFKQKYAEPFLVKAPFSEEAQNVPIQLSSHEGQEFDFIISGKLKVQVGAQTAVLSEGDAIYYDASVGHGMIATDGAPCEFIAVVMKKQEG